MPCGKTLPMANELWLKNIKFAETLIPIIMKEQAINQEFKFYFNLLSEDQKESLLSMMKSFLGKSEKKTNRISIEQYNKELEDAEKRINEGQFVTHESLKEEALKW